MQSQDTYDKWKSGEITLLNISILTVCVCIKPEEIVIIRCNYLAAPGNYNTW